MLRNKNTSPRYDQEYLPLAGVAQTLGVSERTAHSLIHDKSDPIPSFRIGRKILRVRKSDLHAWMEKRRRVDVSEVDRLVDEMLPPGKTAERGRA
jgi:excisionase family DNA binding protein